jgi:hypothetical protein
MARLIFIVSRHRPELFNYLRREFADNADVDVIVDRRIGDRHLREAPADMTHRESGDRRQEHIDDRLHSMGWAIIWRHKGTTVYVQRDEAVVDPPQGRNEERA